MTTQRNNYGLIISAFVHLLIFAVPVSMVSSQYFKEVELFVIDERSAEPEIEKVVKKEKELQQSIVKETPHEGNIIKKTPLEENPLIENSVIKPAVVPQSEETVVLFPVTVPPQAPPSTVPRPANDVEFGSTNGPDFFHRETPGYPLMARRLGKEGRVLLRLTINEKGNLINIEVVEGAGFGLTEAAVEAVKRSTFVPAMQDSRPVMSKALLPVKFILRRTE